MKEFRNRMPGPKSRIKPKNEITLNEAYSRGVDMWIPNTRNGERIKK